MSESPKQNKTVPEMNVEQPRTYRKFRLLVEEVLPMMSQLGQQYSNQAMVVGNHKQYPATLDDLRGFIALLSADEKAELCGLK